MYDPNSTLSDTTIANFAAGILDEYPLASLSDNTPLGRFMARHYGYARDELLQRYPAAFARSRASIPALVAKPDFGWSFAYQLPDACLRLLPLTEGGQINGKRLPYEMEGRTILTNATGPLKVRYIRRVTNAAEFTPLFARVLGTYLGTMAATRITGKGGYFDKANTVFKEALADYQHEDSLSSGTPENYEYGSDAHNTTISILGVRGSGL